MYTSNYGADHTLSRPEGMRDTETESLWFGIYTRPKFEKKLCLALEKARFNVFLPLIKEKRIWSDRIKTVIVPLLPGYLFVNLPFKEIPLLYPFPGFVRVVCSEGKPCPIREQEIELLRQVIAHKFPVQQVSHCCVGDRVRVIRGPLLGYEGRITATQGQAKVVFEMESIQQALSVEVRREDVEGI